MPVFTARIRPLVLLTAAGVWLASACASAPPVEKTGNDAAPKGTTETAAADKPQQVAAPQPTSEPMPDMVATGSAPAPVEAPGGAAATAGGNVFKKKLPAVGAKVLEKESKSVDMTMSIALKAGAKPEKVTMVESTTAERTVEVLAISADAVTKIKVTYKTYERSRSKNGKADPVKAKLGGKTYILEAKDGVTSVTTGTGGAAPEEEVKAVKKDFRNLGRSDSMTKALPDTPLKVGDRVDSIAQALKDRFNEDDSGKEKVSVDKATVTLTAVKDSTSGKLGVFDYAFDVVVDTGIMSIRMPAKGQVEIRMDDGMPLHITMKSPLKISTTDSTISGSGKADMELTREPK